MADPERFESEGRSSHRFLASSPHEVNKVNEVSCSREGDSNVSEVEGLRASVAILASGRVEAFRK